MTSTSPLLAGVELGGTKCVCILGTGPDHILEQVRVPTTQPEATLAHIENVLRGWRAQHEPYAALGIASFGPLDLNRQSTTYGYITATSKAGWRNTSVAAHLGRIADVPMGFDTDVNGAALAEGRWGAARGLRDYAYVTVGTGVGVGSIVSGQPVLGLTHTEAGHIRIARMANDHWPGSCPFHGDCVEGLASGTAIQARAGKSAELLATDDPAWDCAAHALGQLLHTLVLCTAPCRILMGGGVMIMQPHLLPRIRSQLKLSLGGYLHSSEVDAGLNEYIVPPQLGGNAGPLGALVLADQALHAATM